MANLQISKLVLFTLLHEIAHITLRHVDADTVIVESLDDGVRSGAVGHRDPAETDLECEANTQAGTWVFPDGLTDLPDRIGGPWVEATAARAGIAPIVLVGQLQHLKRLDWRTTLARKAPTVTEVLETW